jgi:hypothetical protein
LFLLLIKFNEGIGGFQMSPREFGWRNGCEHVVFNVGMFKQPASISSSSSGETDRMQQE